MDRIERFKRQQLIRAKLREQKIDQLLKVDQEKVDQLLDCEVDLDRLEELTYSVDHEYNDLMAELKKFQDEIKADREKTEAELKILEEISSKGKAKRVNKAKHTVQAMVGLSLAVTIIGAAVFLINRK